MHPGLVPLSEWWEPGQAEAVTASKLAGSCGIGRKRCSVLSGGPGVNARAASLATPVNRFCPSGSLGLAGPLAGISTGTLAAFDTGGHGYAGSKASSSAASRLSSATNLCGAAWIWSSAALRRDVTDSGQPLVSPLLRCDPLRTRWLAARRAPRPHRGAWPWVAGRLTLRLMFFRRCVRPSSSRPNPDRAAAQMRSAFACDAAEFVHLGGQPVGRGEVGAPA
jgi:hypothetical protein